MNRMSEVILDRITFLRPDAHFQNLATRVNVAFPQRGRDKQEN